MDYNTFSVSWTMEMTVNLFKANHNTTNSGHSISGGFKLNPLIKKVLIKHFFMNIYEKMLKYYHYKYLIHILVHSEKDKKYIHRPIWHIFCTLIIDSLCNITGKTRAVCLLNTIYAPLHISLQNVTQNLTHYKYREM